MTINRNIFPKLWFTIKHLIGDETKEGGGNISSTQNTKTWEGGGKLNIFYNYKYKYFYKITIHN